jgi:DNA repair protein RecN (Recombination protein N)
MLLSLSIRNFVIVDELDLDFAPGFTVLTGETGAGKSILIDAVQLALGERADADVVREGSTRAEVAAEFRLGEVAAAWLKANEMVHDGNVALLRRTVDSSGRSRAFINGSLATLAQLRELGELLVDVHGQHAHESLLKANAQLRLLDEHGGLAEHAAEVGATFAQWRAQTRAREEAEAMAASVFAEQDRLR